MYFGDYFGVAYLDVAHNLEVEIEQEELEVEITSPDLEIELVET